MQPKTSVSMRAIDEESGIMIHGVEKSIRALEKNGILPAAPYRSHPTVTEPHGSNLMLANVRVLLPRVPLLVTPSRSPRVF